MDVIKRSVIAAAAVAAIAGTTVGGAAPQDDERHAITARMHGTFQDAAGGLGVVSGDITIARFEVVAASVTAIGHIAGAIADSAGNPLGRVDQELAFPVTNVASTCNQLRMDLAATDATILQLPVHFDKEVAGFDSRDGTAPRARPVLCAARTALHGEPTTDAVTRALNDVLAALAVP